jgi:hypothetical protein
MVIFPVFLLFKTMTTHRDCQVSWGLESDSSVSAGFFPSPDSRSVMSH